MRNDFNYQDVELTRTDGVGILKMNRPEARNAFSTEMLDGLIDGFTRLEEDPEIRVIILTGNGPAFSAGGDIKDMVEGRGMFGGTPFELRRKYIDGVQANTRRMASCRKILIAAVNGHAVGAGLGLALSCDLRIVSSRAKMGLTFPKIGLIAGDGSYYLLQRAIGVSRAAEMIFTNRLIEADEALKIGLAHRVVPPEDVLTTALEVANSIASTPTHAVEMTKSLFYESARAGSLETALALASAYQPILQVDPQHDNAVRQWVEQKQKK